MLLLNELLLLLRDLVGYGQQGPWTSGLSPPPTELPRVQSWAEKRQEPGLRVHALFEG